MFELKCCIPVEKDLQVIVKDYDLIGADDIIGQTYIDLENRLMTKYRATCGIPQTYCTSGMNKWRDSKLPSEILTSVCKRFHLPPPQINDSSSSDGNAHSCRVGNKLFCLDDFERGLVPNPHMGDPKERLCLHILNLMPIVKEHVETRKLYSPLQPNIEQASFDHVLFKH